jgi:hypothetical protein
MTMNDPANAIVELTDNEALAAWWAQANNKN